MAIVKEIQELWESLPKYSFIKIIASIILLLITSFLVVIVFKAVVGEPLKVLGFEINYKQNSIQNDTVYKYHPLKKDTIIIYKKGNPNFSFNHSNYSKKPAKKLDIISNNYTKSLGSNAHVINGNGNSVGINGDQYSGIKQRHISDADKTYIDAFKIEKNFDIDLNYSINDSESKVYAKEIYDYFISRGYSRVRGQAGFMYSGWDNLHITINKGEASIFIPVTSNVQ